MRTTMDALLHAARARLKRLEPTDAARAVEEGFVLIDIRGAEQVAATGSIPSALWIPRNVLEWRVDPSSGHQHPAITGREDRLILLCAEGYASSLAAATLHDLGFTATTDVAGGFNAWVVAGLPTTGPSPVM